MSSILDCNYRQNYFYSFIPLFNVFSVIIALKENRNSTINLSQFFQLQCSCVRFFYTGFGSEPWCWKKIDVNVSDTAASSCVSTCAGVPCTNSRCTSIAAPANQATCGHQSKGTCAGGTDATCTNVPTGPAATCTGTKNDIGNPCAWTPTNMCTYSAGGTFPGYCAPAGSAAASLNVVGCIPAGHNSAKNKATAAANYGAYSSSQGCGACFVQQATFDKTVGNATHKGKSF